MVVVNTRRAVLASTYFTLVTAIDAQSKPVSALVSLTRFAMDIQSRRRMPRARALSRLETRVFGLRDRCDRQTPTHFASNDVALDDRSIDEVGKRRREDVGRSARARALDSHDEARDFIYTGRVLNFSARDDEKERRQATIRCLRKKQCSTWVDLSIRVFV